MLDYTNAAILAAVITPIVEPFCFWLVDKLYKFETLEEEKPKEK